MLSKEQFITGIHSYISNDMLPKAVGNNKIILRTIQAAARRNPDGLFNFIKNNPIFNMLNVFDEHDNVDIDTFADILTEGFASDEFEFKYNLLGKEYLMHFSAADIQTIKRYM